MPALDEIRRAILTILCALGGGWLMARIGAPAPYLLGSLFGVWLMGGVFESLRPLLGIPRWIHVPVILGMGVLVGAMFKPEILEQAGVWLVTVSAMVVATIVATVSGYLFLTRLRGYDPILALFCSLPGGQAEVVLISRELVEKDYVVALNHLVRVSLVFCATPLILTLVQGRVALAQSYQIFADLPGMLELSPIILAQFVGLAITSYLLARLLRLPIPYVLGPILLSASLHLSGLVNIPRISEFVLMAQVVIGGAIGSRLAQVHFKLLLSYLLEAIANTILVVSVFLLFALALANYTGINFLTLLLAYMPGGIYEVTLLTLIFGFDVGFVAFHHTIRVLMIFFSLPLIVAYISRFRSS